MISQTPPHTSICFLIYCMQGGLQSYFLNARENTMKDSSSMYKKKNALDINGHGIRILSFGKPGIEHISAQNSHFDLKRKS